MGAIAKLVQDDGYIWISMKSGGLKEQKTTPVLFKDEWKCGCNGCSILYADEDGTEMDTSGIASSPPHANDVSTSDGTKPDAGNVESLEEAVRRADSGKAGIRMAQIVGIWIGRRQCHALVHLISHCLCKSRDQVSPFSNKSDKGGVESLWLHNWLVREVMQNNSSTHRSPLDWLIAHLTAASPNLFLGPVIYDLWENVVSSRANGMVALSFYVRRSVSWNTLH